MSGEWGYGAAVVGGLDVQAQIFVRLQLVTTCATGGQPSIWYGACDPDVGEGEMGVINCTTGAGGRAVLTALPAYDAGLVMHRMLRNDGGAPGTPVDAAKGFRFVRRLPVFQNGMDTSDDWVLLFRSDAGGVLLVAWTTAQFVHVVRIPGVEAGASFAQTGMFGEARPTLRHDPRGLHVNVTGAPVYLLKQ